MSSPENTSSHVYQSSWQESVSVLLVGGGIGWLMGLSVSPVVSSVVVSLVGIAGSVLTALRGRVIGGMTLPRFDIRPAATLIVAVAITSPLGIYARTHAWFGQDEVRYIVQPQGSDLAAAAFGTPGLFADGITATQCQRLIADSQTDSDSMFLKKVATIGKRGEKMIAAVPDGAIMKKIVSALCEQ